MEHQVYGSCEQTYIIIAIIILIIVVIAYFIYKKYYPSEKFNRNYYGYPLTSDKFVYDSGADLRFGTEFTSTDEGN